MSEEKQKEAIKLAVTLIEKETGYLQGKKELLLERNTGSFLDWAEKSAKLRNQFT